MKTLTAVSSLIAKVRGYTPERVSMKRASMGTAVRLRSWGSPWCAALRSGSGSPESPPGQPELEGKVLSGCI